MSRRGRAYCRADYYLAGFDISVSGSPKWVRQDFPKMVRMIEEMVANE